MNPIDPSAMVIPPQITVAEADAQDALRRADDKARTLLSLVGAALAGVIALASGDPAGASALLLWLSLAPIFTAVVLLLLTLLPRLNPDPPPGTWLYAARVGPSALLDVATDMNPVSSATHACTVARIARAKYRRIQVAVWLLLVGVTVMVLSVVMGAVA